MTAEERTTEYFCAVREHSIAHKFKSDEPPAEGWQVQEMGTRGTGSTEPGDSSGEIFWVRNDDFLKYYYRTFPEQLPTPEGQQNPPAAAPAGAGVKQEHEPTVAMHPDAPHLRLSSAPVFSNYKVLSDKLVTEGPKSGQYYATFECNIHLPDSCLCGARRSLYHKDGGAVQSTNLITHLKDLAPKCPNHAAALALHQEQSKNIVIVDGEAVTVYKFSEAFEHHVHFLFLRSTGLFSQNLVTHEEFRTYVRGYDARATFPHYSTIHRLADVVSELQFEERIDRISMLKNRYKGGVCVGLQIDMWTDTETHTAFACLSMTTWRSQTAIWMTRSCFSGLRSSPSKCSLSTPKRAKISSAGFWRC